jgi:hypothetical protein
MDRHQRSLYESLHGADCQDSFENERELSPQRHRAVNIVLIIALATSLVANLLLISANIQSRQTLKALKQQTRRTYCELIIPWRG